MEEWKLIDGCENYYVNTNGEIKGAFGRVLKPALNKWTGYLQVGVVINGKKTTKTVHTLVAKNLVDGMEDGKEVNHIDGNKHNNKACNLEWITRSENLKHAYSLGLMSEEMKRERGKKAGEGAIRNLGKETKLEDKKGNVFVFRSMRQACDELGLDRGSLNRCKKFPHYTIKGYKLIQ